MSDNFSIIQRCIIIDYIEFLCLDNQKKWNKIIRFDQERMHMRNAMIEYVLQNIVIEKVKLKEKNWEEVYGYIDEGEIDIYSLNIGEITFLYEGKRYIFTRSDYYHLWSGDDYWWVSYSMREELFKKKIVELWDKKTREECYHYFSELIHWKKQLKSSIKQQWEWDIDKEDKQRVFGIKKKRKKGYKIIK